MASDRIVIRGAREHNLKSIDLEIPRDQLVVITGLSGSGKSSLAFDTIYAEGQRRYVESLSAYARQFLEQMEKPDVDSIEGLSPAISIEQKTTSKNPRSTVGTVTEIHDYLRVLFARIGVPHCPECGDVISAQTVQQMVDRLMTLPAGSRLVVLAPVVRGRKGEYRKLFFDLSRQGYVRVRVNGQLRELSEDIELAKTKKHTIEVVVDRLVLRDTLGGRLAESLETALRLADGVVQVEVVDGPALLFSERLACARCGISFPEVSPRMFSFNNPYGACSGCGGLGTRYEVDPELLVPDARKSLAEGALAPWAGQAGGIFRQTLRVLAKRHGFGLDTPWAKLARKAREVILHGEADDGFEGVVKLLERRYKETTSEDARAEVERFMRERDCPVCGGSRLRPETLSVKIAGRSIADVARFSIKEARQFF
ncbi:MAG TPA: excinuclease ABC subunit UvrA, partial [Candidatus Methylomirabilis sp.]|nr:excinuclease ABC subunit UvrA [Candidatus Methylomirabilis sp.]